MVFLYIYRQTCSCFDDTYFFDAECSIAWTAFVSRSAYDQRSASWVIQVFAVWCEARGNIASCGVDLSINVDLPSWIPRQQTSFHGTSWHALYQLDTSRYISYIVHQFQSLCRCGWWELKICCTTKIQRLARLHCTAILVLSRSYVGTLSSKTVVIRWSFRFCSGRLKGWTNVVLHQIKFHDKHDAEMLRLSSMQIFVSGQARANLEAQMRVRAPSGLPAGLWFVSA